MATTLLGLGSNLGNREETLRAALVEIDGLPDVQVIRASEFYQSRPLGGPAGQGDFFNAAVLVETKMPAPILLDTLQKIEIRHGRKPDERWSARSLDIDILLYDDEVMDTATLTLPHPRMTFRRFVLEPAAEIAPRMLHPIVGWPLQQLLFHLDAASELLAIVSLSDKVRRHGADVVSTHTGAYPAETPGFATAESHWPSAWTTWLCMPAGSATAPSSQHPPTSLPYAAAAFPKLTILIDADADVPSIAKSQWSAVVRRPGRGPALRLPASEEAAFPAEIAAAVAAVWPDLGRANAARLE